MSSFFSTGGSLPIWTLGLLFLFFIILSSIAYRSPGWAIRKRHRIPFLFRIGTFLTATVLVGNLVATWKSTVVSKPLIRVFLDNSVSAAYHQSVSTESLIDGYRGIITDVERSLESAPRGGYAEFYSFGSEVRKIDQASLKLSLNEPTTNISTVMKMAGDVDPGHFLAGIVLVTDGQVTMGVDPQEEVKDLNVPVHVVGIGNSTPMVDVDIEKVEAPTVGVRGDMVTAEVFVSSIGDIQERVHVALSTKERLLGSHMIRLSGRGSMQTVKFRFPLEVPGPETYRVQVAALKDEINIANNRSSFVITTLKNRFRVALVTGAPSANTPFIKRVLRLEDRFSTDHFVRHRRGWSVPIVGFWRTNYDLIVLDNVPTGEMSQSWPVDLEGKLRKSPSALAYVAGPNVTQERAYPYLALVGMKEARVDRDEVDRYYPIGFSEASHRHPIFGVGRSLTASFPPLKPHLIAEPASDPVTPLVHLDAPVKIPLFAAGSIKLPHIDKVIRTAMMTSKDLWQLHFRVMRTDYAQFVEEWWSRTFNWLVISEGEGESYFRLNKNTFQQGEPVYVSGTVLDLGRAHAYDADVSMVVRNDRGETNSFLLTYSPTLNRWEGSLLAGKPGTYQYVIKAEQDGISRGQQAGAFRVEESQIELNRVFLNEKLLSHITGQTGGHFVQWEDRTKIHDNLDLESRKVTVAKVFYLNHWLPLCIIALLFLVGEWITRRLLGLQ